MMTVQEVEDWLSTLRPSNFVGIDEGGLTLKEVSSHGEYLTGSYLEIGGIPEEVEQKGVPK